jgi:hypothetical protein
MPAVEPSGSARRRQHLIRRFRLRLRNDRTRAGRVLPRTVRVGGRGPGGGVLLAATLYRSGGCLGGRAVQLFAHCCSPIFVDVVASRLRCCSTRLGWWRRIIPLWCAARELPVAATGTPCLLGRGCRIPGHWTRHASSCALDAPSPRRPASAGIRSGRCPPVASRCCPPPFSCAAAPTRTRPLTAPGELWMPAVLYRAWRIVSGRGQRGRDSRRSVAAPGNGDRGRAGPAWSG